MNTIVFEICASFQFKNSFINNIGFELQWISPSDSDTSFLHNSSMKIIEQWSQPRMAI